MYQCLSAVWLVVMYVSAISLKMTTNCNGIRTLKGMPASLCIFMYFRSYIGISFVTVSGSIEYKHILSNNSCNLSAVIEHKNVICSTFLKTYPASPTINHIHTAPQHPHTPAPTPPHTSTPTYLAFYL